MNVVPCNVCGGTDVNLVDGFYYCVECGTQDMTVRETIVEDRALADGTFTIRKVNKITIAPEETQELCGEWHKWHAFNFILSGLADELIAAGAKPTFKMKLLWLWTKYIKQFQDKKRLGLNKDGDLESDQSSDSLDDSLNEKETKKKKPEYRTHKRTTDLSVVKKELLFCLIYVALNLDRSEIQQSDLMRYVSEGRLDFKNYKKYLPPEIKVSLIPQFDAYIKSRVNYLQITSLALFKCLNILPVLPDLRLLVDRYAKELCLPKDFKNLVFSLMNLIPCDDFLEMDKTIMKSLLRLPQYEVTIMAYFLVAFKMCFGLDGHYEVTLSDAVEKINDENCHLKSYKLGNYSQPTDRLFSFRDWCSFIQLRKIILCKSYLYMAKQYALDVDDFVYMEHCPQRKKAREPLLSDEITMNILEKIPQVNNVEVIPKREFKATLTPMSTYTDLVLDYFKDPDLKLLFSEDFTQYSLKYACEKLKLCSEDSVRNIIGVEDTNKVINKKIFGLLTDTKHDSNMIYVRNCENKNWLKTKQPSAEHVKKINISNNVRESDHGYDSNSENIPTNNESVDDSIQNNCQEEENSNHDSDVQNEIERKLELIEEEDDDKNIFDDDFEDLVFVNKNNIEDEVEIKSEPPEQQENFENASNDHNMDSLPDNLLPEQDDKSQSSLDDSERFFNPETFNRAQTIKELVLATCKKYKIRIPNEYDTKEPRKRKSKLDDKSGETRAKKPRLEEGRPKRKNAKPGEAKKEIHKLLADYYSNLQKDVLFQISEQVKSLVNDGNIDGHHQDGNRTEPNHEVDETNINHVDNIDTSDGDIDPPVNNATNIEDGNKEFNQNDTENEEIAIADQTSLQLVENNDSEEELMEGDPRFNEKEYNIKQLYVQVNAEEENDQDDIFDDPTLNAIVDKKIEEISKDEIPSTAQEISKDEIPSAAQEISKDETPSAAHSDKEKSEGSDSDSDDDIPLSVLKEGKIAMQQKTRANEKLKPLIENQKDITEFKYWTRFYASEGVRKRYDLNEPFSLELLENFPASFHFVIRECARVLDCTPFLLYKSMVALEQRILSYNKRKAK